MLAFDVHAFEIKGHVADAVYYQTGIAGAKIYEQYGSDEPVAVTDKNGDFSYETGSDTPVVLIARKKGYQDTMGNVDKDRVLTKDNVQETIPFSMGKFSKPTKVTIYALLNDDPECVLNLPVGYSGHCEEKTNGYTYPVLGKHHCVSESGSLFEGAGLGYMLAYPNQQNGGFTIPDKRVGEWYSYEHFGIGGSNIPHNPPNEIFYISFPDEYSFDHLAEYWGQFYSAYDYSKPGFTKSDYIDARMRYLYKFCPSKLQEWEEYKSGGSISGTKDISPAEQKYADAKENENSLANRTLGSVTMAATGIGGMELARGLAEQKADAEADAEMNMYISTFQCKVGENGKYYQGGTKSIETPGANQLIKLYQEYVDLAADLKARKEALGQKPGIESEVILDKAATGMYDEVGHGIENGTFASIYRASKGNATDAQKLDDAKSASKKRVIGGAVAAGAGAVGGMVGNMIINGKKNSSSNVSDNAANTIIDPYLIFGPCPVQECLANLTITEKTKQLDMYGRVINFCSEMFPNEPDCQKIMLIYADRGSVQDIEILKANNYDIDYYKTFVNTSGFCDDACKGNAPLFDDDWYKAKQYGEDNAKLINWMHKCFKLAGATDYFLDDELQFKGDSGTKWQIDYDKIDCTKLDEGKTDQEFVVRGNKISPHVTKLDTLKKLLGNQAIHVHGSDDK